MGAIMAKRMFTDLAIRNREAHPSKRLELPDAGARGLYVCIQPGKGKKTAKSFAMRFRRPDGRNARLVLGDFALTKRRPNEEPTIGGDLTVGEARLLCGRIHHQRASGVDVISDRKADKINQRLRIAADQENSFTLLARRYFEEHARHNQRRWAKWARYFGLVYREGQEPTVIPNSLCYRWADRPVGKIGPADIKVVVDEAIRRAVPGLERRREMPRAEATGRTLHARLSAFFGWCVDDMRIEANPCTKFKRPSPGKSRDRVLSDDELVTVWKSCDQLQPQYGAVARLLILTGARLREIGHMTWSELNDDLTVWTLPKERAKNKTELLLPLPKLARAIIRSSPRIDGSPFVFTFDGDQPVESFSRMKRRLDALAGIAEPWRLHDFRRTVATGLQRLGIKLEVTEAVLNHTSGSRGGIVGVYQRHDYADEKRVALERWAAHVEAMVEGRSAAKVVELAAHR
jgi:integrase